MLNFFLYTILFLVAGACASRYFYLSAQPEQVVDVVFGWQNMLQNLHDKGKYWGLLAKGLGDCEMCYCSLTAVGWFTLYALFMNVAINTWIPTNSIFSAIALNIIWYFVYASLQFNANLLFVTGKLFNK